MSFVLRMSITRKVNLRPSAPDLSLTSNSTYEKAQFGHFQPEMKVGMPGPTSKLASQQDGLGVHPLNCCFLSVSCSPGSPQTC